MGGESGNEINIDVLESSTLSAHFFLFDTTRRITQFRPSRQGVCICYRPLPQTPF